MKECWLVAALCGLAAPLAAAGANIGSSSPVSGRKVTAADLMTVMQIGGVDGGGLSISPDGKLVAFQAHQADVARNDYRVAWFVAGAERGGKPVKVADGGEATLFRSRHPTGRTVGAWASEYAKWSPDGRGITYRKKFRGQVQVWWSSRDGHRTEQLTHSTADVVDFRWSPDGSRVYFTTDADRVDLRNAKDRRYRNGHVFDYEMDWSTIDARPLYSQYALTGGEPRLWVLETASGRERLATDDELEAYQRLRDAAAPVGKPPGGRAAVWTNGKRGLAWVQADDPAKQGWHPPLTVYASRAAGGSKAVKCQATECTGILDLAGPLPKGLDWTADEGEVLFVRKEGMGYSRRSWYGWRIGESHARRILTTTDWISDCAVVEGGAVAGRAICFRQTPSYPRTVISIDLSDGSIDTLVDLNPDFSQIRLGDVELFEWENARGYGTFGYLVKPPDYVPGQRYPLVFVGYRAKWAFPGGVGDEYPVQLLAANGFIVLVYDKPTTYAAQERYTDPLDIARARWGPELFDVSMPLSSFESAIRMLAHRGLVDPDRVAVTGLSNGAAHVNYAIIHSNLFAAAIASSSNFGPNSGVLSGAYGEFITDYRRVMGAGPYPGPNASLWPQMSLALNAEQVQTPLLINCSDSEHPWALEEVVALIRHGKPVEMVVYPDEGHIKWHPAHRASIYQRNVDWLKFWLQDVEDPDPGKDSQYARWHALRAKHAKAQLGRVH